MKNQAFSRVVVFAASALAALGCASQTPGNGNNPDGGSSVITPVADEFKCLSASAGGTVVLECKASYQLTQVVSGKNVSNGGVVAMAVGSVKTGDAPFEVKVSIKNSAAGATAAALIIESIHIDYANGAPQEADEGPALDCLNADGSAHCNANDNKWRKVVPVGTTAGAGQTTLESFTLTYKRYDSKDRTAKVTVNFRGVDVPLRSFTFNVNTQQGKPKMELQPPDGLTFPYAEPGKAAKPQQFNMLNSGDAVLSVSSISLATIDPSFTVKLIDPPDLDKDAHVGGKPWNLAKPLEIDVGKAAVFEVGFSPKDDKKKSGKIEFVSNDPRTADKPILTIQANTAVPAIKLDPTNKYQFGGAVPGGQPGEITVKILSIGSSDLVVTNLDFLPDPKMSNEFAIDQSPLAGKLKSPPPISDANPLVLKPSETAEFKVSYAPSDITDEGAEPDFAEIQPKSNAFISPKLRVEGVGVKVTCPIAKVIVAEGEQVIPQTTIHLKGDKSLAPGGGTIKKYKWTVKQPTGSNQALTPNASFANPTLLANASGEYEFCLEVWDGNDSKSCVPACQKVLVIPNNALHIELLWDTPSDPDQTDNGPAAGADMDLHFAHPLAATLDLDCDGVADPWFSNPWDTFWFNAAPEWGAAGNSKDNPTLDLDDTDGAGPENLNLVDPEGTVSDPVSYSVGVHYWNDHGFGTSYATVSIYIQGGLALQFTKIKMDPLDMWYVGKVNWPNTASGGNKKVFDTCYQSGLSCPAKKNLMWQPKGDWCITKCYVNKVFNGSVGGAATGKCGGP